MDKKLQPKNSSKLEKLHEFARKGGIGKCVATRDTLANTQADLMFYSGEVITILKHLKDDIYLGYCEGVIGRFHGKDVSFNNDQLDTQKPLKPNGRPTSGSPDGSTSDDGDKNSNSQGPPHIGNFLSPSDAEHVIRMRSRSSSISSLELDSGRNTPSSSVPSSPVLTTAINITPGFTCDDVSITPPTLSEHLHNKDFQNSSPSFNSNPDKSQTSQRETPQISNDQSNRTQSDPPLLLNSRPISFHSQEDAFPASSNQIRKMSSPFPSQIRRLSQTMNAKRNNSAPPLTNNDSADQKSSSSSSSSSSDNPEQQTIRSTQNPAPPISDDQIRPVQPDNIETGQTFNGHASAISRSKYHPDAGSIVDSPTSSPNSSPRASSDISTPSPDESPNSVQYKGRPQAFNVANGSRPIHTRKRSASNMVGTLPRPSLLMESSKPGTHSNHHSYHLSISSIPPRTFGQHLNPVISESPLIIPPQRKSSMGLSNESSSVNSRPQVVNIKDRYSPSTTTSSSSPTSQKSKSHFDLPGAPKTNQTVVSNPSSLSVSCVPQIFVESEDIEGNDPSMDKSSTSQSIVPPDVNLSGDQELSIPTFMIEAVDDTDDSSSEDEDEEHVKLKDDTSPESKKDKAFAVDEYGFVHDVVEGDDGAQKILKAPCYSEKNSRNIRLYREREAKWVYFLGNMDPAVVRQSKKIKKLVRLGIPESVRGKSWQLMAGVHKYRKDGVYEQLCKREKLSIYDVIERDIRRCYPDHIQFREETGFGQDDLHNILKAYAHYNQVVGYCQGMGRLVGMMLMQMPAEDTFWLLVATIEEYMVGYFTPTLSQVRIDSLVFEQLLLEHDPKLAQHLADSDVVPLMYMTQWFMTVFTMALPWASVLRVWDVFYFEGVKFFHRVGLAILDCTREHILKSCPSSSEILGFLLHIPHELLTPDLLLEATFKIKLKLSTIERMKRVAIEIENNNNSGTDNSNLIHSVVKDKEAIKAIMKKAKSADKLKIDGIEFKMVGEGGNP